MPLWNEPESEILFGNTMGNLGNGGLIAGDGDEAWIALPQGLLHIEGESVELVYEGSCTYLNVTKEYIYFVNNRSQIIELERDTNLPRVLVDRTGHRYDEINNLVVVGYWLFYSIYWGAGVYRVELDTGREQFVLQATCLSLVADKETLYYVDDTTGVIQQMGLLEIESLLALSKTRLAELWYEQNDLNMDDFVEFMRRGMAEKIDLSMLVESEPLNEWDGSYFVQPHADLIFYLACNSDDEDSNCYLHALNPEAGDEIQVLEDPIDCFNLSDKWIFVRKIEDQLLYRIPLAGGPEKRVFQESVERIFVMEDNRIWCTHPDGDRITRLYSDGSGKDTIVIEND